ncbi:hypothetical protein [Roseococcus pinisoli]|uniref:Uncharacterized protein n=1 Tax=Roseococcus pinisoli TaxID=2835040 RepID=A0ABS5QFK0_9PROT|nr:hypothetical protein [Roseococcus pinisoli]MBS7812349.1 hypothetical protein [Roseococcus pinisoli]
MSLKVQILSSITKYQSKSDPDYGTDQATTFELGPVDVFCDTQIFDRMLEYKTDDADGVEASRFMMNQMNLDKVRFGLRGWTNFQNEKGEQVAFSSTIRQVAGRPYTVASNEAVALLGIELVRELAEKIRSLNIVTAADAKNSISAP